MGSPTLPRALHDPTGLAPLEKRAGKQFIRRIKSAYSEIITEVFDKLEYEIVEVNEVETNAKFYHYNLDAGRLAQIGDIISDIIKRWLLVDDDGNYVNKYNPLNLWFMKLFVRPAYQKGTAEAYHNLAIQSEIYQAANPSLESVLMSEPYMRRIGLVAAREFELMEGFGSSMVKISQQILSEGIATGTPIRTMAKELQKRTESVHHLDSARALRIVQTEIPRALRHAKMDEQDNADVKFNVKSMVMPISAFMETSRPWHMRRHGTLVTTEEQRKFYLESKNSIACHCSAITVVLGSDGQPLSKKLVEKAVAQRERFIGQ